MHPIDHSKATVFYDSECRFCIMLARILVFWASGSIQIQPRLSLEQDLQASDKLLVRRPGETDLIGNDAWEWLTTELPLLNTFTWLISKIFATEPKQIAGHIEKQSQRVRRLCKRC